MFNFHKTVKKLLIGESLSKPDAIGYIQSLMEILNSLNLSSMRDRRKVAIAKEHLKEIRKETKKILEENKTLNEKISLLEENNE